MKPVFTQGEMPENVDFKNAPVLGARLQHVAECTVFYNGKHLVSCSTPYEAATIVELLNRYGSALHELSNLGPEFTHVVKVAERALRNQ